MGISDRSDRGHALGQGEEPRHAVDLALVQVRDRLDVGRAVAVLDEEALVVLQPVRRAGHRVVQLVGVEVFERLADTLLEVGDRKSTRLNSSNYCASRMPFSA